MIYLLPFLTVLAGFLFVRFAKPNSETALNLLLAFSGAFLLALTVFELLPEVYAADNPKTMGVFIIVGILLQIILEFFSKGAEHGHVHFNGKPTQFPITLFISLCLHAVVEGFSITENNAMIYGILVHKVPVAIILGIFLMHSKVGYVKTFWAMTIFAFMTPLGTYLAHHLPYLQAHACYVTAVVVGVFLHVATVILFESSEAHTFNLKKMLVIVTAMVMAYVL